MKIFFPTIPTALFLLIYICIINCSKIHNVQQDTLTLEFTSTHHDSAGFYWGGVVITATISLLPPYERIKQYPENYKIKETYYMNLQSEQYYYSLANRSNNDYNKVKEIFKDEWFDKVKDKYSKDEIDCLVSYCTLENQKGESFVVFDQNNDEDFTNDTVLPFKKVNLEYGDKKIEVERVQAKAQIEYFDGEIKQTSSFHIGLTKQYSERLKKDHLTLTLLKMEIGKIRLENKDYKVAIINEQEIEYDNYSSFWFDSNQNGKLDYEVDVYGQMHKPLTLLGQTYEVSNIDRFGKFITLKKSDLNVVPPISKGILAPDFQTITIDSIKFKLSQLKGKYVLIDFWGTWCRPCVAEVPNLKKAFEKYKNKNFEIVSIGVDDPSKLRSFIKEKELNWIHIQQNKDSDLAILYQISGFPSAFLLDKKGIILAMGSDLRGEKLIETLDKYIL